MANWHKEHLWRCACGSYEFLEVSCIDWGDHTADWEYSITLVGAPLTLWARIHFVARFLFKRENCWREILLRPEQVRELADVLIKYLGENS